MAGLRFVFVSGCGVGIRMFMVGVRSALGLVLGCLILQRILGPYLFCRDLKCGPLFCTWFVMALLAEQLLYYNMKG